MGIREELLEELYKNFYFSHDITDNSIGEKKFNVDDVCKRVCLEKQKSMTNIEKRSNISCLLEKLSKEGKLGKERNNYYLTEKDDHDLEEIENFENFKKYLDKFKKYNVGKRLYFRGENSTFPYRLPSIYRDSYKNVAKHSDRFYSDLFANLGDLNLLKEKRTTQLARLQHFQSLTRLLDITSNPLIALYFAVESQNNDKKNHKIFFYAVDEEKIKYQYGHTAIMKASVNWIDQKIVYDFIQSFNNNISQDKMNKDQKQELFLKNLNEVSQENVEFSMPNKIYDDLTSATFVEFVKESTRMKNQSGTFIMPPHITRYEKNSNEQNEHINTAIKKQTFDEDYHNYRYKGFIIKDEFSNSLKNYLSIIGINAGKIYPDIKNYSNYLFDAYYK